MYPFGYTLLATFYFLPVIGSVALAIDYLAWTRNCPDEHQPHLLDSSRSECSQYQYLMHLWILNAAITPAVASNFAQAL